MYLYICMKFLFLNVYGFFHVFDKKKKIIVNTICDFDYFLVWFYLISAEFAEKIAL